MEKKTFSKRKKDYLLAGAILLVVIVALAAGMPMIYSVRFSQRFIEYKEHLQDSFYYGTQNNTVLAESDEGIWRLTDGSASNLHTCLVDGGMGKLMKEKDIPQDTDRIRVEFGDGAFLDFYRHESGNDDDGDLIVSYSSSDYGPYIYLSDRYSYNQMRSIVMREQNKKLK
ncbi:MAG: hypothetical protein K5637_05735 [Lachnospiraceae bacterium]|nr:hypothetical protein [Lachnospiraceae bacterium]